MWVPVQICCQMVRDAVSVFLSLTLVGLSCLLAYIAVGVFGVVAVLLLVVFVYLMPGDLLKSIDEDSVRIALLLMNGLLVGWIPAEYLGDPPLDESGEMAFVAGLVVFSFGFVSVFAGLYSFRRYYHISHTPTDDVASVEEGTVEVEGEIEPARGRLEAPVSGDDCVAYEYEASQAREWGSRTYTSVVETERDGVPFYVDDGTGRVLVDPEGADIAVENRETETVDADSSEYDRETTLKEVRVPTEGHVYVFGSAGWSDEHGQTVIQNGLPFFKISDSSESELLGRYKLIATLCSVTTLVGLPVGLWLVLGASSVL